MERERVEREKLEKERHMREEHERQDRELQERERDQRQERQRVFMKTQEVTPAAAVNQHFIESLKRASQRVGDHEPSFLLEQYGFAIRVLGIFQYRIEMVLFTYNLVYICSSLLSISVSSIRGIISFPESTDRFNKIFLKLTGSF